MHQIFVRVFYLAIFVIIFGQKKIHASIEFDRLSVNQTQKLDRVPGEFIVKLKKNFERESSLIHRFLDSRRLRFKKRVDRNAEHILVEALPAFNQFSLKSARRILGRRSVASLIEPNYLYYPLIGNPRPTPDPEPDPDPNPLPELLPNDSLFSSMWGLRNLGQRDSDNTLGISGADISAPEAWRVSTGDREVVVAVIDTGVDYSHPDLRDRMWSKTVNGRLIRGYNAIDNSFDPMDDVGHGTHVAGTIGASGNNRRGIVGVNWNVKIMPVKFLGPFGGSLNNAIKALDFAIQNGADVINNSWGGGAFSQLLKDKFQEAEDAGSLNVIAAGNDSNNNDNRPTYPASYDVDSIVSVAASTNRDTLASFSNYGRTTVDLAAPGHNIISTVPDGKYDTFSGTSMAAPHVAGAASLLLSLEPGLTPQELKDRLIKSVDKVSSLSSRSVSAGRLNLYKLITD